MNNSELFLIESARAEELKTHAVEFANRIKDMFPIMTVENGQWVLESQISTELLYNNLFNPKESMTPAEKAKELLNKIEGVLFNSLPFEDEEYSKEVKAIGLIAVEEILSDKYSCSCEQSIVVNGKYETYISYYTEVKNQIELL